MLSLKRCFLMLSTTVLVGKVIDTFGVPLAGARVIVTDPEMGRERVMTTNEDGLFQGRGFYSYIDYDLRVEAEGFETIYDTGVRFTQGSNTYDAVLEEGVPPDLVDYDGLNKLYEDGKAAYEAKEWTSMESSLTALLEGLKPVARDEDAQQMQVSAHELMALASFEQDDYEGTLASTAEMLKLRPNSLSGNQLAAQAYTAEKNFEGALPHLRIAAAQSLDNAELQYNTGAVMLQLQHVEEGIEHMERALALREDFTTARKNLGFAYLQTQEYDKSIVMLESYLEFSPDAPDRENIEQMLLALRAQIGKQ